MIGAVERRKSITVVCKAVIRELPLSKIFHLTSLTRVFEEALVRRGVLGASHGDKVVLSHVVVSVVNDDPSSACIVDRIHLTTKTASCLFSSEG